MKTRFDDRSPVIHWFLLAIICASCRPATPQMSKLWVAQTADDFARLLQNGRFVAQDQSTSPTSLSLASGPSIAGIPATKIEMDQSNQVVEFVQFDPTLSPAVSLSGITAFATDLITKASADLKINPSELVSAPVNPANSTQAMVAWSRNISGIPLRDSRIEFVFAVAADGSYHLIEIQNRTWGHLKVPTTMAAITLDQSKLSAVTGISTATIVGSGQMLQVDKNANPPTMVSTTWYKVKGDTPETFNLTFAAGDQPRLVEAYSSKVDAVVYANTYDRNYSSSKSYYPIPDAPVDGASGRTMLDSNGNLPANVTTGSVSAQSTWVVIHSDANSPTSYDIANDGTRLYAKTDAPGAADAMNVYLSIARIRSNVLKYLTVQEVPYLNMQINVTTDIQQSCNAYYQGLTLNFFQEGGGCANMSLVNDVIYHEWGHGLDDYTGPGTSVNGGGITDSAFSEGIGDINAMFLTKDSDMAPAFYTSDSSKPIRRLENTRTYVPGQEAEMHIQGTIVGGAFWELRKRMINKYGDAGHDKAAYLFYQHLKEAETYSDSYKIVQRIADHDNNPAVHHPDWCLINHAFAVKGLATQDPCQDDYSSPSTPYGGEFRIFVATGESPAPATTPIFITAAFDGAAKVKICSGSDVCTSPVVLAPAQSQSGLNVFGPTKWDVQGSQIAMIQVLDGNDQELGRRIVRFFRR